MKIPKPSLQQMTIHEGKSTLIHLPKVFEDASGGASKHIVSNVVCRKVRVVRLGAADHLEGEEGH